MDAGKFECLRCATCCRNLLEGKGVILRGLPLTDKEVGLFPTVLVSPKMGIGSIKLEEVVLYQLNINCCPYVTEKNECKIYSKRPLMCQSFPIVAGAISNRCKTFSYRKPGVTYTEPYNMEKQVDASEKLEKYVTNRIKKHRGKATRIWEYDLATKKWKQGEIL